jgi:hypothetical protein
MALPFPTDPSVDNGTNIVNGTQINRTWQYSEGKNRWELVGFDSVEFVANLPITHIASKGNIITDFDVQDLTEI